MVCSEGGAGRQAFYSISICAALDSRILGSNPIETICGMPILSRMWERPAVMPSPTPFGGEGGIFLPLLHLFEWPLAL